MTQGEMPKDPGSRPAERMPSDKCDFVAVPVGSAGPVRVELSTGAAGHSMHVVSDKCDWRIATGAVHAHGSVPGIADDLQAKFAAGRLRMDSDKCDWRIRVDDRESRSFRAQTTGPELEVRGSAGPVRSDLSSREGGWSVRMTGAFPGMRTPSRLHAEMDSDKCDFAMRVELGVQGGPMYRLRAVGSDKCDFRVIEAPEGFRSAEASDPDQSPADG
jgi:hypothetical protein